MTRQRQELLIAFTLALVVFAVFSPVLGAEFVALDDDINIYLNPHIQTLDWPHLRWMFADCSYMRRYVPASWLNWAVLYHFWGSNPLAFHLESLLLHAANVILVFWCIRKLLQIALKQQVPSGPVAIGSALGALLWAVHPLRVEAVAWANCEMYPQSFFFLLLSLLYYLRSLAAALQTPVMKSFNYWLAIGFLVLSLLTYPTGIGFVVVLVMLDVFPLRRLSASPAQWLANAASRCVWVEKIPFVLVTVAVLGITLWARMNAHGTWEKPVSLAEFSLGHRISQAFYILAYYVWKPLFPHDPFVCSSLLYSFHPLDWPFLLSIAGVGGLTWLVIAKRREWPAAWVLWVCHLALLSPMLGWLEHPAEFADRYGYIVGVLFSVLIAVILLNLWSSPFLRAIGLLTAVGLAGALGAASYCYCHVWHDSISFFQHNISKSGDHPLRFYFHWRLGMGFYEKGKLDEAIAQYITTLRLKPDFAPAHNRLGVALSEKGLPQDAIVHYAEAIRLKPDDASANNNLAWLLATCRDPKFRNGVEAVCLAGHAVELLGHKEAETLDTLAAAYAEVGRFDEAVKTARQAVALAEANGRKELAAQLRHRLELYERKQPYHE